MPISRPIDISCGVVMQAESVYIYGAGFWGRRVHGVLAKKGVAIDRVLVTDASSNVRALCGTKVVTMASHASEMDKMNDLVVVCVKERGDAIVEMLRSEGFQAMTYLDLLCRRAR